MAIEDTSLIDAVIHDSQTDTVSLVLIHAGHWFEEAIAVELLREKLSNYLQFLSSGQFDEMYPEYLSKKIKFQLECTEALPIGVKHFIEKLNLALREHDIDLDVNVHEGID